MIQYAVAAACMARGLDADSAERVWLKIKDIPMPFGAYSFVKMVDDAIDAVTFEQGVALAPPLPRYSTP